MIETLQQEVRMVFGDKLDKIERWSRFRSGESREEWLRLLGPTAVVLTHQEHLVNITQEIAAKHLSESDLNALLIAWAVHDIGETVKGDIPAPDKKNSQEKAEHRAALKLLGSLSEHETVTRAYREIVMGENLTLHTLFKGIEKSEYVMTAMHVFEAIREEDREVHPQLWVLVARVIAIDLPKAIDYALMFPEILGSFFQEKSQLVDDMFEASVSSVNVELAPQFEASLDKWQRWLSIQITT